MAPQNLSWFSIFRLGLVNLALGSVLVLTNSTFNRVMTVELTLAATVPGALVTLYHVLQILRPRMGHGSDLGHRRTPWMIGGVLGLAAGGFLGAVGVALMSTSLWAGLVVATLAFCLIGVGVSSAGTSLLVVLARRVAPERRGAAATLTWMLLIVGLISTAGVSGKLLDPFSFSRLVAVAGGVAVFAVVITLVGVWGIEKAPAAQAAPAPAARAPFREALAQVWSEPDARAFTIFVLVSMLAYSAQDLILEPFAGLAFGFTPGESTRLSGIQNGGLLGGMILAALVTYLGRGTRLGSLKLWVVLGCGGSALAMAGLTFASVAAPAWPLRLNVALMGLANGAFTMGAIASMMALAGHGRGSREGVRMGLWGAAQAIAFASGGFVGTVLADLARLFTGSPTSAYGVVFALEGVGFVAALLVALKVRFHGGNVAELALASAASEIDDAVPADAPAPA